MKPNTGGCEAEALGKHRTKGFTDTLGIKLAGVEPFMKVFAEIDERPLKDQPMRTGTMTLNSRADMGKGRSRVETQAYAEGFAQPIPVLRFTH